MFLRMICQGQKISLRFLVACGGSEGGYLRRPLTIKFLASSNSHVWGPQSHLLCTPRSRFATSRGPPPNNAPFWLHQKDRSSYLIESLKAPPITQTEVQPFCVKAGAQAQPAVNQGGKNEGNNTGLQGIAGKPHPRADPYLEPGPRSFCPHVKSLTLCANREPLAHLVAVILDDPPGPLRIRDRQKTREAELAT